MGKYFALVYEGTPFQLFGTAHLIALAIITLCCFSYLYFRKVWGEKERNTVRWVFAIAIGSNYLFIAYKPDFPTLLDMLAPWPWYILEMEALGFAIFGILYLPFLIKDLRAKQQPALA